MNVSRGRCLLTPLIQERGWSQTELSRRTGYDPHANPEDRTGYSPRMISFFAEYDGKGNGKKDATGSHVHVFSHPGCSDGIPL